MNFKSKIRDLPDGLVVNRVWLKSHGVDNPLVDYYVRKGYLEVATRGVYRRPGPPLKWQHIVYSLQVLGHSVHVGGATALALQGLAHYLPFGEKQIIHLFGNKRLPGWLYKINVKAVFVEHSRVLFNNEAKNKGLTTVPFGSWAWPINVALPERAVLEMLMEVPKRESFHVASMMMESAVNLRPKLLTTLLEGCTKIKAKRLFLWLAETYRHQWVERLNLTNVGLGSGKRVIQKNGKLDSKYLITVPRKDVNEQERSIF